MSLAATVLIPTHDHGRTLLRSVPSALAQTVTELEVFVVGDGVPDETRELMAELAAADERVRFFDNPKGERHGEAHRHAALQEARGEIVCYLSDDDVWLPDHVEELQRLLADADLAHTVSFLIDVDERLHVRARSTSRASYYPPGAARRGQPDPPLGDRPHDGALPAAARRLAASAAGDLHRPPLLAAPAIAAGHADRERDPTDGAPFPQQPADGLEHRAAPRGDRPLAASLAWRTRCPSGCSTTSSPTAPRSTRR